MVIGMIARTVDMAGDAKRGGSDTRLTQLLHVRLAVVAQWIELRGDDDGGRQAREVGREPRRHARVGPF